MQPLITVDLMTIFEILRPLALNILGIAAFGVFIFNFYRFIARKDIITLNLRKHHKAKHPAFRKVVSTIFYLFKCLTLYPVLVFFWFCVMAAFLYLLGRGHSIESVMLAAMGVVGAVRVCAYYREALATDISKILPFALLGILIIDNSLLRVVDSAEGVMEAALLWETLVLYLGAVVVIELVLRMVTGLFRLIRGGEKSTPQAEEDPRERVQKPPAVSLHEPPVAAREPAWTRPQTTGAFQGGGLSSERQATTRWNGRDPLRVN